MAEASVINIPAPAPKGFSAVDNLVIPGGSTLLLEKPELNYDSTIYALKFQLTSVAATQLVDIKVEY